MPGIPHELDLAHAESEVLSYRALSCPALN